MARTVPIVVQDQPDTGQDWRRFVAALCLIEFYVEFVDAGSRLYWNWDSWVWSYRPDEQWCYVMEHFWCLLRACAMFGLGRALWRNLPSKRRWLLRVIVFSLFWLATTATQAIMDPQPERFGWWSPDLAVTGRPMVILFDSALQFPWLLLLITCLVASRLLKNRPRALNVWVVVAALWCIAHQPVAFANGNNPISPLLTWWSYSPYQPGHPITIGMAWLMPPLVGISLLFSPLIARILALCTTAMILTALLTHTYFWLSLHWAGA